MAALDAHGHGDLFRGAGRLAVARVHDDVERTVRRVATRLDRARHVLDAQHRSAHDGAEIVLHLVGAEATPIRVEQRDLDGIVGGDLDFDFGHLTAHRRERAEQRETRHVVVCRDLAERERDRGVLLSLRQLERRVTGDASTVARGALGNEEMPPLAREMAVPEAVAAREPAARLRRGAAVCGADRVLVVAARATNAIACERPPRRRDRRRIDDEPAARARRPVAEPRIEALPERVEHRERVAAHVGGDVEMMEERRRDALTAHLGSDAERCDRADAHGAAPEPPLHTKEEGVPDELVAARGDDEVVERPEPVRREVPPSLVGRATVRERRQVDLEDAIEVVRGRGSEAQILDGHGVLVRRSTRTPQTGPCDVEDVRPEAMATEQAHSGQTGGLRLGGARADFVAGLGRKVTDLRAASAKVREMPEDLARREELRRKLHALSSAAKIMKFDAMDRAIAEALGTIDRSAIDLPIESVDLDAIDQILEDLPALAWGDGDARVSRIEPVAKPVLPTYSALVVGSARIAEALLDEPPRSKDASGSQHVAFACESTPDAQAAFDLARTSEPDLVVLDADLDAAAELVEALMDDPVTEAAPIVVVGSFLAAGEEARYVAMGVAKTLAKPTSKSSLRHACEAALHARSASLPRIANLGTPSSAPTSSDQPYGERARVRLRGPAAEVRLQGRRVVVADDDPAVVWFLADLLKTSGCIVHEAFDGKHALEVAYRTSPDLMICDIMMPEVDGFTLCRMLRRDVALRDVPVILLSWKEDLLQRVRELGAGAAGYVRKESDTRAIVARIREALRPRSRIETRLRDEGEVRGRMDGISVRTLLEIVCATRPEARVSVRDASFNYEVEIRDGAPQRATRTAGDGTLLQGTRALSAMLGVGAGRFTVATCTSAIEPELDGNLPAQLAKPIACARAATALLAGAGMMRVGRVILDEEMLEEYLRAMPEQARKVALRIADGASPRALVLDGVGDASLIEDIVCDLGARGIVTGVEDDMGDDLLAPEIARVAKHADTRASFAPRTATPSPAPPDKSDKSDKSDAECVAHRDGALCESPEPGDVLRAQLASESPAAGASLEDAVLREIGLRSPEPAQLGLPLDKALVHPASLRPRSSPPAAAYTDEGTPPPDQILAMAEATIVENTTYEEREAERESVEPSIPIEESSKALPLSESRSMRTPLTAVTTREEESAGLPAKRKAWPMVAFVAVTGVVAWAVMHFTGASHLTKQIETAPPAPVQTGASSETVTYTSPESDMANGHGLLEISAPGDAVILVDGTERGRGGATLPLWDGVHDVRISGAEGEQHRAVEVRAGRVAHIKF